MTLIYADTSALIRAYFRDEPDHAALRQLLFGSETPVVSSELARVELAAAVRRANRAGRLPKWRALLTRIEDDCGADGAIRLLRFVPELLIASAVELVTSHRIRTLDALHVAAAWEQAVGLAGDDALLFVTRDKDQASVASALGLAVA